jgi:glucose dehydrogenase
MQRGVAVVRRSMLIVAVGLATVMGGVQLSGQASRASGGDWAAPGGDWAMTRYSALAQIDTRNVGQLAGAWSVDLPAGQVSKAPLMVSHGRMFAVTSQGVILALDPATGATQWTYRPDTPFSGNRGIGIGNGLLFAGLRDSSVIAISQATGQLVWKFERPPDPVYRATRRGRRTATCGSTAAARSGRRRPSMRR